MALNVYPPCDGEPLSSEYRVTVSGVEVPVYLAQVAPDYRKHPLFLDAAYSFAGFDVSGQVEVSITSSVPLESLSVRGVGFTAQPALAGCRATFQLDRHGALLIERNGNGRRGMLVLSANPLEIDIPEPRDPGVRYFGPGRHDAGLIELRDGETLYLDGGAVVTGRVEARGDDIRICGRGILGNDGWAPDDPYYGTKLIDFTRCRRARLEGIVLRKQSRGWTTLLKECDDVEVSHVKIMGSYHGNDDGIDPVNTRNLRIEDCFIRTKDDCLAFKGMDAERSNCEAITVSRTMMWSDQCCTILFGDECRAAYMRNIQIRDCFVPYLSFEGYPKKFLMLHAGEEMRMEDILIEDIEIGGDGQSRNYMEMTCEFNRYSESERAGHIRDIRLRRVQLEGPEGDYRIVLQGFDDSHGIDGVTFEACTVRGERLTDGSRYLHVGDFVQNIDFRG